VALKMIHSARHASQEALARFRWEAMAIACMQHPNIVQIYHVGDDDGRPYLVLEYVDGGDLKQRLRDIPLSSPAAATLWKPWRGAMHYAHGATSSTRPQAS